MKKIITALALSLIIVVQITSIVLAQSQGNVFDIEYLYDSTSGLGEGEVFTSNVVTEGEIEASGEVYETHSPLIDTPGDINQGSTEVCSPGQSIACTSVGNWAGGTATCSLDNQSWVTTNCIRPVQAGSGPSGPPSTPPTHEAAPEEEEEEEEEEITEEEVEEEIQVCGNGLLEEGEQCDDGNMENDDGCDAVCKLEEIEGVVLTFTAYPEKRLPASGNWTNVYDVSFYVRGTRNSILSTQLTTNNAGIGQIITDQLPRGNYDIVLKGTSHLRIPLTDIQIEGDRNINATHKTIYAGDVQGDNFVNALDISRLLSTLYTTQVQTDLNRDGIVNALDISIMLGNLYRAGE